MNRLALVDSKPKVLVTPPSRVVSLLRSTLARSYAVGVQRLGAEDQVCEEEAQVDGGKEVEGGVPAFDLDEISCSVQCISLFSEGSCQVYLTSEVLQQSLLSPEALFGPGQTSAFQDLRVHSPHTPIFLPF